MSQIWKNDKVIPVTVIEAGPVIVTQIRTKDNDGYTAVQVGFGAKKEKNIKKPQKGHFKKSKIQNPNIKDANFRYLKEFRFKPTTNPAFFGAGNQQLTTFKVGDMLDVSQFSEGDKVKISGLNKGRGFQGVVKRHGFHGGPKTHGQKDRLRAPGSIGATAPQRVLPGLKMAGRMGLERVTVKNLKIAAIDKEKNLLMVKGAVPGMRGTILEIQS